MTASDGNYILFTVAAAAVVRAASDISGTLAIFAEIFASTIVRRVQERWVG